MPRTTSASFTTPHCRVSDTFIATVPLATTPQDERALAIRLDAARHIQNAVLGECLRVLDLMRESKAWQAARRLPKGSGKRRHAFREILERFDFKPSMADRFAIACKNACWIGDHLTSNETQKAASRAFAAVAQHAFGRCGRPRFKRYGEVHSVEGKSNAAGIRWRYDAALRTGTIEWSGLKLRAVIDLRDVWLAEALQSPTKYVRLIHREIRGSWRWVAQLVQQGEAPNKYPPGKYPSSATSGILSLDQVVGLDLGPSTIAAVAATDAVLERFCPEVEQPWAEMRRLERAMDRSRRATNPDNYCPDGTLKPGKNRWNRSKRYQMLAAKRRERERVLAARRQQAHGRLVHRVLAQGTTVKTEALSYRAWQKCFGRSIKVRAPASFLALLKRRAVAAGGAVIEFSTRSTRLSQFDHTTGEFRKKPLSQRVHVLGDGSGVVLQRDLYSAFLARFVGRGNQLDVPEAAQAFAAAKPLLWQAASGRAAAGNGRGVQTASGGGFPHPSVSRHQEKSWLGRGGAVRLPKRAGAGIEAADDVTQLVLGEGCGEMTGGLRPDSTQPPTGIRPRDKSRGMV